MATLSPDDSRVSLALGISAPMFAITAIAFAARTATRFMPGLQLGWDDVTITIGFMMTVMQFVITVLACQNGVGRHTIYVPLDHIKNVARYEFVGQLLWIWSITFVKISVALSLIRITRSKRWTRVLYCFIGLLLVTASAFVILQLIQCRPTSAFWDPKPGSKCWSRDQLLLSGFVSGGVFIATDLLLSLFPLTFLRKLNRPRREKIVIALLMSLGLVASAASTIRLVTTVKDVSATDPLWGAILPGIWGSIEEYLAIIAACLPFLRLPFEKMLGAMGLMSTGQNSQAEKTTYPHSPASSGTGGQDQSGPVNSEHAKCDSEEDTEIRCHEMA